MLRGRPGGTPAPRPVPSLYLHEEGSGGDLVLLVASLQEWDEQIEDAAQLLAGVLHHGPGGGGTVPLGSPAPGACAGWGPSPNTQNSGKTQVTCVPASPGFPAWTGSQRPFDLTASFYRWEN